MGRGRRRRGIVLLVVTGLLLGGVITTFAAPVGTASQPPQPPAGAPGGNGPCELKAPTEPIANPAAPALGVWVFQPSGTSKATIDGGRCDSPKRPTWFLAHGLGSTDPSAYIEMIEHLVSVGNVVVYPTYEVNDGEKSTLEEAYGIMDAGIVEAARSTPRIDTTRVGWWGHSMGGSMVPFLVQQGGARRWGGAAIWMNNVAQTFALRVGRGDIRVPPRTQVLTVAFEHDELADARIGIDVFNSVTVPAAQKRHVIVSTDLHGQPAFVADHGAPSATDGSSDAVDFVLWRYLDMLQLCSLRGWYCETGHYPPAGTWSDGTPIAPATLSPHPVDAGPYPAVLAECDGVYGQQLNQDRIHRCGPTHL